MFATGEPLPETCARCGAPVDEFTAEGTPLCRACYVRAVCASPEGVSGEVAG